MRDDSARRRPRRDEEDEPRRPRSRDDDEQEEDRPRRRPRDEPEDEEPRRRRRKKMKISSNGQVNVRNRIMGGIGVAWGIAVLIYGIVNLNSTSGDYRTGSI